MYSGVRQPRCIMQRTVARSQPTLFRPNKNDILFHKCCNGDGDAMEILALIRIRNVQIHTDIKTCFIQISVLLVVGYYDVDLLL